MKRSLKQGAIFFTLGLFAMTALHAKQVAEGIADVIESRANHPNRDISQPSVLTRYELHSENHIAEVTAVESLWANYVFYNDTHNGPGVTSLFTDDAIVHIVWNNHYNLVPTFGIHPYQTPDGLNGGGCVLSGHKDVAQYFGFNRTAKLGAENHNGLAIPGATHHQITNDMVRVTDDGKSAMLTSTWFFIGTSATGGTTEDDGGTYRTFFRKMPNGWDIADMYIVKDRPSATTECDMNGPIPRPE